MGGIVDGRGRGCQEKNEPFDNAGQGQGPGELAQRRWRTEPGQCLPLHARHPPVGHRARGPTRRRAAVGAGGGRWGSVGGRDSREGQEGQLLLFLLSLKVLLPSGRVYTIVRGTRGFVGPDLSSGRGREGRWQGEVRARGGVAVLLDDAGQSVLHRPTNDTHPTVIGIAPA